MITNQHIEQCITFAESIGLIISNTSLLNAQENKIYRCGTVGHPTSLNGWHTTRHDGFSKYACFVCGNHENGNEDSHKLSLNLNGNSHGTRLSKKKFLELKARIADQQRQIENDNKSKAQYNSNIFNKLKHCLSHPYATKKQLLDIGKYGFKYQIKYGINLLCIPFYKDGIQHGFQTIPPYGTKPPYETKRFNGAIKGCYWSYSSKVCRDNHSNVFILGEGVATVLSAFQAIENSFANVCFHALVAFSANNLGATIRATEAKKYTYVLLVDNDRDNNVNTGVEKAFQLLKSYPDCDIKPLLFPSGDANDYVLENGQSKFIEYFKQHVNLGDIK